MQRHSIYAQCVEWTIFEESWNIWVLSEETEQNGRIAGLDP